MPATLALVAAALAIAAPAAAQANELLGTTSNGLRGLFQTGLPMAPPEANLSATAGYGLAGTVQPANGAHPRALGSLAAALALKPWLAVALRMDGRVDFHAGESNSSYSGAVGDPRLFVRGGQPLSESLSIGVEFGVWVPGREAPSFRVDATTLDSRVLFAWQPPHSRFSLLAAAGFRLDNSSHCAPDLTRLRAGDRVALGLSDFDAALAALGAAYRLGARSEVFGELSADMLVGDRAPGWRKSPLRAALGARYFASASLQAELASVVSLSERPGIAATDPLVPIEPRVGIVAGLRYGFRVQPRPSAPEPGPEALPPAPEFAAVAGSIVDQAGEPVPEAVVVLRQGEATERSALTDARGRYRFGEVSVGPAQLEVRAIGFNAVVWNIAVGSGGVAATQSLTPARAGSGLVRGLVRSFGSEPLSAQVQVRTARGATVAVAQTDAKGRFELELAAGSYEVTISAPQYHTHRRNVQVASHAVAILNVDMRELK